jgi:Rieske Fe-S protein
MSMVMFATICDHKGCQQRSDEYTHWPECRECMQVFCTIHQVPESLKQDDYGGITCLCLKCAAEETI